MHAHHLHSRIEQEYAAGQNQIVEFSQVGEESLGHVHVIMSAGSNVNDTQYDQ